jgi:hypothetical protein
LNGSIEAELAMRSTELWERQQIFGQASADLHLLYV